MFYFNGWVLSADRRRFATEESLKEIHRVLRPGAAFGVIWNIEDCVFSFSLVGFKVTDSPSR